MGKVELSVFEKMLQLGHYDHGAKAKKKRGGSKGNVKMGAARRPFIRVTEGIQKLKSLVRNSGDRTKRANAERRLMREFGIFVDDPTYPCTFKKVG